MAAQLLTSSRQNGQNSISKTACERCRRQKLRCSRQRPICERCSRFSLTCTYPKPADRKLLAARREAARAELEPTVSHDVGVTIATDGELPRTTPEGLSMQSPIPRNADHSNIQTVDRGQPAQTICVGSPLTINRTTLLPSLQSCPSDDDFGRLPPRAIGLALLDIYFERLYNADLLFHRARIFELYIAGTIPQFLLRSIFALSSLFLRKPSPVPGRLQSSTPAPELVVLAEYASSGSAWAESARREVWLLVDKPSIEVVQALSCLNLYWFAVNNMDRARINAVMSFTCSSSLRSSVSSCDGPESEAETWLRRRQNRCFWACWATMCVSAFPDAYAKNAWEEAHLVPLPSAHDKAHETSETYCMDREWKCQTMTPASGPSEVQYTPFVMAEYMKLMGIWVRVQIMTRNSRSQPNIPEIEHLSHLAKGIYESTHFPTFPARAEVTEHQTGVLGLHSLYHMCQIIVLCPLVSLFSGRNVNSGRPSNDTRTHVESVTKHALSHCKLINDYVAAKSDISRLSPLVGFGSFVATSILLTLLKSRARRHQDAAGMSQSLIEMIQNTVDVLNILQTYWEPLEPMAKKLYQAVEQLVWTSEVADDGAVHVSSRIIEVPLTGVNSPAGEEDVITTTYIDSPGRQSGSRPLDPVSNPNMEIPGRNSQQPLVLQGSSAFGWRESDMFNPDLAERLSVLNEDLDPIDFSMADWDMDLLSEFPVQMA